MHDIVKYSEDLAGRLQKEFETLVADREMTRDILDARRKELVKMRDDELRRLEQFYQQQKSMVSGIFQALLSEIDADLTKNDEGLKHLTGNTGPRPRRKAGPGGGIALSVSRQGSSQPVSSCAGPDPRILLAADVQSQEDGRIMSGHDGGNGGKAWALRPRR